MRNLYHGIAGGAILAVFVCALTTLPVFGCAQNASGKNLSAVGDRTATASDETVAIDTVSPDLGTCTNLNVEDERISSHLYADGVQIYRWNGVSWVFLAPDATLYADADFHGVVGTHYAGPTWESNSGSKVVASATDRCTPDPDSIPWLKLEKVYTQGPGIFDGVSHVQRLNTVGGKAPATAGNFAGEVVRVPYTAEYVFYKPQHQD